MHALPWQRIDAKISPVLPDVQRFMSRPSPVIRMLYLMMQNVLKCNCKHAHVGSIKVLQRRDKQHNSIDPNLMSPG